MASRELRDPTREELYAHEPRRALPAEIQQMTVEDTACTFCGVSYFVFAEVQELQATVNKYKQTFRTFVRFLERERRTSQDLRAEVASLRTSFEQLSGALAAGATQLATESSQLRAADAESRSRLRAAQREVAQLHDANQQVLAQAKRAEDEWRMASALTEQKLRNEVLHLSSQIEKCKLQSATQEAEFAADCERDRAKIRELEARFAEGQATWSSSERQAVSERDELKQKLLAMKERVEEEKAAAKQLETQLRAVQQELARVVSAGDAERAAVAQMNSDVIMLKHQLHGFEKNKALLLSERAQLQEEKSKSDELVPQLLLQVGSLQKRIEENASAAEKLKHEYGKELKKLRLEHAADLARLQRDHARALDELKAAQSEYVAFLKMETSAVQQGAESAQHALHGLEKQLRDAERQVSHWRDQAERSTEELQSRSLTDALEKKVVTLETDKSDLEDEHASLQRELDLQRTSAKQQLDALHQDSERLRQRLEAQSAALQKRAEAMQTRIDQLELERSQLAETKSSGPQLAWGDDQKRPVTDERGAAPAPLVKKSDSRHTNGGGGGNQENHDYEKLIEKLRLSLDQKDREIALLQQTVHRECLERTSLLEKMRGTKILPDVVGAAHSACGPDPLSSRQGTSSNRGCQRETASNSDDDESSREPAEQSGPSQPKASFYEKLRKAGQRKSKPRK